VCGVRRRYDSRCRVEASAQCRSSRARTTVCRAAVRSSRRAVSSYSRAVPSSPCRAVPSSPCRPVRGVSGCGPASGSSRASSSSRPTAAAAKSSGRARRSAQGGDGGGERQGVGAGVDAAAGRDDSSPARGGGRELLDEPGLADAGLAADQDGLRQARTGPGERAVQGVQFTARPTNTGLTDLHSTASRIARRSATRHRCGPARGVRHHAVARRPRRPVPPGSPAGRPCGGGCRPGPLRRRAAGAVRR
jgi:hypothetical protein